jgi:hypothetical protein
MGLERRKEPRDLGGNVKNIIKSKTREKNDGDGKGTRTNALCE